MQSENLKIMDAFEVRRQERRKKSFECPKYFLLIALVTLSSKEAFQHPDKRSFIAASDCGMNGGNIFEYNWATSLRRFRFSLDQANF